MFLTEYLYSDLDMFSFRLHARQHLTISAAGLVLSDLSRAILHLCILLRLRCCCRSFGMEIRWARLKLVAICRNWGEFL